MAKIISTAMATMNKISMWISVFVILLSWESIDAQTTSSSANRSSEKFKGFNRAQDHLVLAHNTLENFNRIVNCLMNNSEFQPLFLSIGSFGFDNKIFDRVTEYLTERTVDYHRFDLKDFDKRKPRPQSGLTWIIVADEYNILLSHVLGQADFWKAGKQFFIFFVGNKTSEQSPHRWSDIFKILWNRYRVCKVLIASVQDNLRHLYRYMPFHKVGQEFGIVQRVRMKDTSSSCLTVHVKNGRTTINDEEPLQRDTPTKGSPTIFENFQNFNGYPMYVTVFDSVMMNITKNEDKTTEYTMLDANVMNLVEERLGSKFHISVIDADEDGDPFMTALDTIDGEEGEADIVFTAYFAKLYLRQFVFTMSIFEDKVCLIGPSSEPIPKFFMPLLPFANELWLLLVLYNLVVAVLWLLIQRIQSTLPGGRKATGTVPVDVEIRVLTYRVSKPGRIAPTFNQPRPLHVRFRYPKPQNQPRKIHPWIVRSFDLFTLACYPLYGGKTCTERAFLFGTLFFGLIVIGLYQSYLVSSLSKPTFYPELNTLSDVVQSNRTIVTKYKNLQQDTFTQGSPVTDRLQTKIEISTSQERTYDMVAYKGFVSIGRFSSFQLENLTDYYNKGTNKLLLHMVEECPATYHLSYPLRLYSPYLERIDGMLLRMQQSGLISKWYDDMLLQAKIETAKSMPSQSDERVKLTLEHLSLAFLGLGIGLFSSAIVLLGELHYARRLRCATSWKRLSTSTDKQ